MFIVGELTKFFGLAFSALLPLVNPLGSALVFVGFVGSEPLAIYRRLARRIAISTIIFLISVEAGGALILKFFGISLPVVQISGGLALAAMGWKLLNQDEPSKKEKLAHVNGSNIESLEQKIFYPFTFPITVGPGCIVVMVTLSAQATGKGVMPSVAAHAGIVLAVVLLCVAVYFCYGNAPTVTARISQQTAHGLVRLIAFVLLCIGVQITLNGLEAIVKTVFGRT